MSILSEGSSSRIGLLEKSSDKRVMNFRCIISAVLIALAISLEARATDFTTKGLERLASCVGLNCLDSLSPGTHYIYMYKGRKLSVRVNDWKEVEHIGLLLFPKEMRRLHPLPIYDFLERYLLTHNALPETSDERFMMGWDKVHFDHGDALTALKLDTITSFSESHVGLRYYKVSWADGERKLLDMSFQIDYQLLTGCNALELENALFKKLRRGLSKDAELPQVNVSANGMEYTKHGTFFVSPLVRNDIYYTRETADTPWTLLADSARMIKTISNIMIAPESEHAMKVRILLDKYGLRTDSATVDYKVWRQLCINEGCVPYFGLKSKQEDTYKCSIFMVNETGGYLHLLSIDVPTKTIMYPEKYYAQARLYCYIPLHNISENVLNTGEFKQIK